MRDDFNQDTKWVLAHRANLICSNPHCETTTGGPQDDPSKALDIGVTAELQVTKGGVRGEARAVSTERIAYRGPLPDLHAYLRGQTELTRSTLVRILKGSGRLPDFPLFP